MPGQLRTGQRCAFAIEPDPSSTLRLQASQHPRCRLRVTIVPRPAGRRAPPGAGSKFQLSAAMVAHAPLPLNFYHRQAADVQKLADR